MPDSAHEHFPSKGDFWSQVPVVAFAAAAVIAVILVNARAQPAGGTAAVPGKTASVRCACADCGAAIPGRAEPPTPVGAADSDAPSAVRGDGVRALRGMLPVPTSASATAPR